MKLFSRKQQQLQPIIPPELQPYYNMQSHQKSMWRNRQVLLPVGLLLLGLLIVGVVIWQILDHTASKTNHPSSQATQSPQANSPTNSKATPAQTPSTGKTNTKPVQNPIQ